MNPRITTRAATEADGPFLFAVYAGTRQNEVAGWPAAQQEAFLRMQSQIRTRAYDSLWPGAESLVILAGDRPVGSLLVHRGPAAIHLVDIALLPEARGAGIGSRLISELQEEAARAGKAVTLRVHSDNLPARRLYERLGFRTVSQTETDCTLEWRQLALPDWAAQVGTRFQVALAPDRTVTLELTEAGDRGSSERQEQFGLLFRGPLDVFLPQQTYRMGHETLGSLDLFLVPVARDAGGLVYEAIFNRWKQREA